MKNQQTRLLFAFLVIFALAGFLTYAFFANQLAEAAGMPMPDMGISNIEIGLINVGIILVGYGLLGLLGIWFARKLGLPGVISKTGTWRSLFFVPLLLGIAGGTIVIIGDRIFAPINGFGNIPHPPFPVSILASISAGIGEEIIFRGFVFGLWGFMLSWVFKKLKINSKIALWIANLIAALAFGAGHLSSMMILANATTPAELSPILIAEILILNGILGLVAGHQYIKKGLVAAVGVHFWTDMIWHVAWGLLG